MKTIAFASAAHEFKNPLNGIVSSLELLSDKIDHTRGGVYYTTAKNCTKLMLSLIKDIMDLSQMESKSFILNYSQVDMQELINECMDIFQSKAKEKGILLYSKYEKHFIP
jgi:signal transduction histidine kinase